jgi:hypothetical protein
MLLPFRDSRPTILKEFVLRSRMAVAINNAIEFPPIYTSSKIINQDPEEVSLMTMFL